MTMYQNQDWPQLFAERATSSQDERLRAYYRAGCIAADTPLEDAPLVALDVETTGLDPREHAIVSLGLVPLSLQRIRCSEARYWVVKPTSELSAESVTFHHITHSDIRHAPAWQTYSTSCSKPWPARWWWRTTARSNATSSTRRCASIWVKG